VRVANLLLRDVAKFKMLFCQF